MMQNMIQQMIISTHSLTRRLTSLQVMSKSFGRNFNSQPHKEADKSRNCYLRANCYFNSQPHKEADLSLLQLL